MRILRVADVPNNRTGGMSRAMYSAGDAMVRLGHTVEYAFADHLGPTSGVKVRRFVIPWRVPALVRRMSRLRGRYDVVEVHEPLAAGYCLARAVWPDLPPLVVLSHGLESQSLKAAANYRRAKGLPNQVRRQVFPYSVVWQAELGLRLSDHVACLNTEDEAALRAKGVPHHRITRTRSGVGDAFLRAGRDDPGPGRTGRMLFVGNWLDRKGILDLIPAVTDVLTRVPDARFTVAGCGATAPVVLDAFPATVRDRITVVPRIETDDELIRLYRGHQILVLPSYFEGQPLVMLEAAALKLAIVTTGVCGMRDFVRDGESGLLVRPADPAALTAGLLAVVSDPNLARRFGESAYQAAATHTWDRVAQELLSAYRAAIQFRARRSTSVGGR